MNIFQKITERLEKRTKPMTGAQANELRTLCKEYRELCRQYRTRVEILESALAGAAALLQDSLHENEKLRKRKSKS